MKRSRFARRGALNRDAEQLARLATGLGASARPKEDAVLGVSYKKMTQAPK